MRVGRVKVCSLQILLLLTYLGAESFNFKKKYSTNATINLFNTTGEFLANNEKSNLDFDVVKFYISSGHLGFTSKSKKRFFFRRIAYYSNSSASFQPCNLLACGDVHPNPGYTGSSNTNGVKSRAGRKPPLWKHPCAICSKAVRSNQKGILCEGCGKWHHIKCINMDTRTYIELSSSDVNWYCNDCTFPFNFTDSFFEESTEVIEDADDRHSLLNSGTSMQNNFLSVLLLNARSIRNKVSDLQALMLTSSFDVIAMTETWLDAHYHDFELHLESYNVFRKDRCNKRGGGVLIAVRNHISCIHRRDLETEAEMLAIEIHPNPTTCVLFCTFYRAPNADESFLAHFRDFLENYSRTGLSNLIITGDFNFPNINWNLGCPIISDPGTEEFCNILDDFFLHQKTLHPTRVSGLSTDNGNILDLVLTNNEFFVEDVMVRPNAFDSDHYPVTFKIRSKLRRPTNVQRKVYCYKKADFTALKETLQTLPWDLVTSDMSIDSCLEKFQDILFPAIDQHIPQVTIKRRSRPPWIYNEIMKLIRKKKKLWKRLKASGSQELFVKFKNLRKKTKRLIDSSYHQYLKSLSGKLQENPKHFWSFYSMKSKTKRIPETVIYDNVHSSDLKSKVELFNNFFHSIYSTSSLAVNLTYPDVINPNLLSSITTTASEVEGILNTINIHKASGPDNIPARILRSCATELSVPLAHLFNVSVRSGVMPMLWKSANITPIHKGDERELVENYRSVSLLPIPAKCLERLIHSAVYDHVSPYLSNWQHGFVKGRSCETQLVLTHHHWAKALDEGRQVDVAFLDFSKAFDKVSHSVLLQKLCSFGISGALLQWCESYLMHRRQRVVLNGVSSSWCEVTSGVPQGSLLGPLFFVIFISDLPEVILPGNIIALYADDCKTSRIINTAEDQNLFQQDLDNLNRWSIKNAMKFNVKKCKIMRITKKKQPFISRFSLEDTVLEEVDEFKDLGIITDHYLNWNSHTDKVVAKANKMLGLMKRTCKGLDDLKTLRTLYCSLVRSNLEYCSVVWSPYTKRNIEKIERVQRRATKFILKTQDNYDIRLMKLNLMTLENRRVLADVTFLFKALNGISNININSFIDFYSADHNSYSFRHFDSLSLKKKPARTNVLKYSFFNRIVDSWNQLPKEIRSETNIMIFKSKVKDFLLKQYEGFGRKD